MFISNHQRRLCSLCGFNDRLGAQISLCLTPHWNRLLGSFFVYVYVCVCVCQIARTFSLFRLSLSLAWQFSFANLSSIRLWLRVSRSIPFSDFPICTWSSFVVAFLLLYVYSWTILLEKWTWEIENLGDYSSEKSSLLSHSFITKRRLPCCMKAKRDRCFSRLRLSIQNWND